MLRARVQTAEGGIETAGERPNPVLSFKPGYNSSSHGISPWIIEPGLDLPSGPVASVRRAEPKPWPGSELPVSTSKPPRGRCAAEVRRALLAIHAATATGRPTTQMTKATAARLLESQLRDGAARPQDVAATASRSTKLGLNSMTSICSPCGRAPNSLRRSACRSARSANRFRFFGSYGCDDLRPGERRGGMRSPIEQTSLPRSLITPRVKSTLRLEVAKQFPNIKLGPGYKLDQTDNEWTLGIGLKLPTILNQHKGPIAEAEGQQAAAADSMPCRRRLSAKSTSRSPPTGRLARKRKRPAAWLPRSRRRQCRRNDGRRRGGSSRTGCFSAPRERKRSRPRTHSITHRRTRSPRSA